MEMFFRITAGMMLLFSPLLAAQPLSSTAQVRISLTIPESIRLSGLHDITMRWQPDRGDYVGEAHACVTLRGMNQYTVTLSSRNSRAGRFVMTRGDSRVPYAVRWNQQSLTSGLRSAVFQAKTDRAVRCSDEVVLQVETDLHQARQATTPGEHEDILTVRLQAE